MRRRHRRSGCQNGGTGVCVRPARCRAWSADDGSRCADTCRRRGSRNTSGRRSSVTTVTTFPAPRRARSARRNCARCGPRDAKLERGRTVTDSSTSNPIDATRRPDRPVPTRGRQRRTAVCPTRPARQRRGVRSKPSARQAVDPLRPAVDRPQHRRRRAVEADLRRFARHGPFGRVLHSRIRNEWKGFRHRRTGGHACRRVSARAARISRPCSTARSASRRSPSGD